MTLCKGTLNVFPLNLEQSIEGDLTATLSRNGKSIDLSISFLESCENTFLFEIDLECEDRGKHQLTIQSGEVELYSNTVYIQ